MALYKGICRTHTLIIKIICSYPASRVFIKNVHNSNSQNTEIDSIDIFTTQLIKKKSYKWEVIRIKKILNENKPVTHKGTSISKENEASSISKFEYDVDKLDELIDESIEVHEFKKAMYLTNISIENKICPSSEVVEKILSYCAQNGDKDTIVALQKFVAELKPEIYKSNAEFLHYLAEAAWVKGNINESVKLFDQVYSNYTFLRRKTRLMIKYLVYNVVTDRSEAGLVLLIRFAEKLAKEYNDYFPLSWVWHACFISEWFADQCRASEILDKHEDLFSHVKSKIPNIVKTALKNHQPEVVHRLFEMILKYKTVEFYIYILQALFNYRYYQNDLRSCEEIIQWSLNFKIPLSTIQHKKFISLLLNHNTEPKEPIKKPEAPKHFELKF